VRKNTPVSGFVLLWLMMLIVGGCNLIVGDYQQADGRDAGNDANMDAFTDDGPGDPDDGWLDAEGEDGDAGVEDGDAEDGDAEDGDAEDGDAEDGDAEDGDDGSADDGGCTDECGPLGAKECINPRSFHTCLDIDGCLKWSPSITCECQQCVDGVCEDLGTGWRLLGEPTVGCGLSPCQMWDNFCTTSDRQYMILRQGPDFLRWYEPCNIFDVGLASTSIECRGIGKLFTIKSDGLDIYEGDSENFGPNSTWSIYHREFDGNCLGVSYNGCGQSSCTLVDFFNLTPTSRYFVRQQDGTTTRWFSQCSIKRGGISPPGQLLTCQDASEATVSFHSESVDMLTDYLFSGSWTFCLEYANSNQLYLGPAPGCGASVCELWNDFEISPSYLYDVRWHSPNAPEESAWFGTCLLNNMGLENEVMVCISADDRTIRLRSHDDESSSHEISEQWSLHRITLP